jgi:putative endonuclease
MTIVHSKRRQFGFRKESLAVDYLISQGLKLAKRNYQCRRGEIDLIVQDRDYLVFVEVRFRSSHSHGSPAESVDKRKQARIICCALHYLAKYGYNEDYPCRFDVVAIQNGDIAGTYKIDWIRDAFQS